MHYSGDLCIGDLVVIDCHAWAEGNGGYPHNCPSQFYRVVATSGCWGARTDDIPDGTMGFITRADPAIVEGMFYVSARSIEHAVLYGSDCCVLKRLT